MAFLLILHGAIRNPLSSLEGFDGGTSEKKVSGRRWFVEKVQGGVDECQQSAVSKEQLQVLVDACKEAIANEHKAEEILPTQGGFSSAIRRLTVGIGKTFRIPSIRLSPCLPTRTMVASTTIGPVGKSLTTWFACDTVSERNEQSEF